MINSTKCDLCDHYEVCGFKLQFNEMIVQTTSALPDIKEIDRVLVQIDCKYYCRKLKENPNIYSNKDSKDEDSWLDFWQKHLTVT